MKGQLLYYGPLLFSCWFFSVERREAEPKEMVKVGNFSSTPFFLTKVTKRFNLFFIPKRQWSWAKRTKRIWTMPWGDQFLVYGHFIKKHFHPCWPWNFCMEIRSSLGWKCYQYSMASKEFISLALWELGFEIYAAINSLKIWAIKLVSCCPMNRDNSWILI